MKVLLNFIFVFIFLSIPSCIKDTSPLNTIPSELSTGDDSGISDSIRSLYKIDAAYLEFRHIYDNKMSDTVLINIPQTIVDAFYSGLIHIYNCKSISSIDTVTKIYPVHTFPERSLNRLVVGIDTSYTWTKQWQDGITMMGNDTIDSLIALYDLELDHKARYRMGVLITKKPLNMFVLGEKFRQVAGIRYAEPDGVVGSGNDIKAIIGSDYTKYTYTIGWGDCPAGCTASRYWEYTVSSDGEVRYLGSYGAPYSNMAVLSE